MESSNEITNTNSLIKKNFNELFLSLMNLVLENLYYERI